MKNKEFLAKNLSELGLSENEAAVYLALISLAKPTVLLISRTTGIKRTTVYHTLGLLAEKGLARLETKAFKEIYVPEDPSSLKEIIDLQAKKLEVVLPDLNALYTNKGIEGSVKKYEGMRAIEMVYMKLLDEVGRGEDYCVITDQEKWLNLDKHFFEKFIEKRAKLNLKIRLMFTPSETAKEHQKYQKNFNEQIKLLPQNISLNTNLIITKHKVIIHRLQEPFSALVLDDPLIVQMHKENFEVMWRAV